LVPTVAKTKRVPETQARSEAVIHVHVLVQTVISIPQATSYMDVYTCIRITHDKDILVVIGRRISIGLP
jgi:hypothetical protein